MRSPNQLCPPSATLNLTSMIDVVFLLIIFFLVSSELIQQENAMEVQLPSALSSQMPEEENERREVIEIRADGQMFLRTEPVTLEQLREYFRTKREQGEKEIAVVIRTDRQVLAKVIKPLLVVCAKNNIWNVSFSTTRDE